MGAAGNGRTIELMQPLLRHERHFIRWSTAQAIAAIDREAGLEAIAQLSNDAHPEVRNASRKSLEQFALQRTAADS